MKDRIENLKIAERGNRQYFRRIRVRDYLPGQAIYNLGDYPEQISARPTEYDKQLIGKLAKSGVKLIQLHEDWNDAVRLYGGDKFHAVDPEGMKAFVELCHEHEIKVIAYVSSGYFQETDPDFREEYTRSKEVLAMNYFKYRKGHHGNALWREYIIPKTLNVMEEYGFDGIYNDWGYDGYLDEDCTVLPEYDGEVEDLLSILYSEVKKRGGIYKLHCDRNNKPPCIDKVYDYLWIGEWVETLETGVGKYYDLYVVPCQDRHRSDAISLEAYMARTIPFLQFPLLKTGRPVRGENTDLPGVTYYGGDEQTFYKAVHDYRIKNPEGPQVYSLWSSIPDDIHEMEVWNRYFQLYQPMVTENSLVYLELRECDDICSDIPQYVYASMFVNEKRYLVVSNLGQETYRLMLKGTWMERMNGYLSGEFEIAPGQMCFLEEVNEG